MYEVSYSFFHDNRELFFCTRYVTIGLWLFLDNFFRIEGCCTFLTISIRPLSNLDMSPAVMLRKSFLASTFNLIIIVYS